MPSVTTHNSYGSRVGNSFKAIFWGIILVWVSIRLLAWNENNYVKQKAALEEWASQINETVSSQIDSNLEWKEVHLYGETASDAEALQDNEFWVITDDLKLRRTVEMYQWYEESDTECHDNYWGSEDCETTYTYNRKWSEDAINSNNFYEASWHENPSTREFTTKEQVKSPITLWAYTLAELFVNKLDNYTAINLSEQNIIVPEKYKAEQATTTQTNEPTEETSEITVEDNNNSYLYGDEETNDEEATNTEATETETIEAEAPKDISTEKFHKNSDYNYIWENPSETAIWDLKITFSSVKPSTVSIVWKQIGNEFTSYTVSNGRSISLLEQWNVSAEDMFLHAQQANKNMTWILRLLWLFLMYCGFAMMFKFIETIAKVLPFLANIIWVWTGIIALWLTLVVGFVTIWIAWLAIRPVIWIICLVVAIGGIFLLKKSKKDKKSDLPIKEKIEEKPELIEQPKE